MKAEISLILSRRRTTTRHPRAAARKYVWIQIWNFYEISFVESSTGSCARLKPPRQRELRRATASLRCQIARIFRLEQRIRFWRKVRLVVKTENTADFAPFSSDFVSFSINFSFEQRFLIKASARAYGESNLKLLRSVGARQQSTLWRSREKSTMKRFFFLCFKLNPPKRRTREENEKIGWFYRLVCLLSLSSAGRRGWSEAAKKRWRIVSFSFFNSAAQLSDDDDGWCGTVKWAAAAEWRR